MTTYTEIKNDSQIKKFCLYGFLKNQKFFVPYLLIYMMGMGMNLFQIGIMFSIREGIMYVFEVPSGIIADQYGKKKELLICFSFYIISFICFFFGYNIWMMAMGMVFFGLGEAFRSGTHKAMILSYLEHKGWYDHKSFVYGRTRSYSLLGSSLSAFLSIILVINIPALKWVFLASIIPYIGDFLLILSYPEYLDEKKETERSLKAFAQASIDQLKRIVHNPPLIKVLLSSATYDGVFKTIKDYIQPILHLLLISAGIGTIMNFDGEESLKIYLGLIYGVFFIFSSMVSKNIYRATNKWQARPVFDRSMDLMGITLVFLSIAIGSETLVIAICLYFIIYLMMDARRPVFVDVCSNHMDVKQRVTVLSVESQIRALIMIIIAPVFGWIADHYSISILFLGIGLTLLVINRFLSQNSSEESGKA